MTLRSAEVSIIIFLLVCVGTHVYASEILSEPVDCDQREAPSFQVPEVPPHESDLLAGCREGRAWACQGLAARYWYHAPFRRDAAKVFYRRAVYLFEKSCTDGRTADCDSLANLLNEAPEGISDPVRAHHVWLIAASRRQASCEGGDARSCYSLAIMHKQVRNYAAARAWFLEACDRGFAEGCSMLGFCYRDGTIGVLRNELESVTYFGRACDLGDANSCAWAAIALQRAGTEVRDLSRAAHLYQRGCDGQQMKACFELGLMKARGDGQEQDRPGATRLLERACAGGVQEACTELETSAR
jgi:uncharacterized protein